jgi:hypothetical protein
LLASDSGNTSLPQNSEGQRQHWKSSKSTDKKVKRYANELHPGTIDKNLSTLPCEYFPHVEDRK